jgi:hypothetical protein
MRTREEIERTLNLVRRFSLREWIAPLRWALGEDTLPYLDTDANPSVITVMLEGWFNRNLANARSVYHYYSGGISLCGTWNLVEFGNPENPDDIAAAERKVKSWAPVGSRNRRCMVCERKMREQRRREQSCVAKVVVQPEK